jgi:chaperonin GroES
MAASANSACAAAFFFGQPRLSGVQLKRNGDFAMKIRPLHDRVIVKRMEEERKTASGIVIPDTATEKPDQGEIIAVGAGKKDDQGKLIPLDVKVGDRVLFGKYAGQAVKVEGEELLVMREEDIMGVVEK